MSALTDVFEYYELELNSQNKCCCPFHSEKTPSFSYDESEDFFWCFGCGAGSDVFDFVKLKEGCGFKEALSKVEEITGLKSEELLNKDEVKTEKKKEKIEPLSKEQIEAFFKRTTYETGNYRGIRDEIHQFFGHRVEKDSEGKVIGIYYPETHQGKLTGYKKRNHPKDFSHGKFGTTGSKCDLAGQVKFKSGGKFCVLVGGEEDMKAAYQMFLDNQNERGQGDFEPIPVVSPTVGEGSSVNQIAAQYDWFDQFEVIVVGMDNDDAGKEATKKIIEVLPKDKVKIATWSGKDPNKMLNDGRQKQFIRDFWQARDYVHNGILTSVEADAAIEEELSRPKVSLPPFMSSLQDMCAGGFPLGYIINIIATTGLGKSTVVNEAIRHWIFNSPHKIGIMSLELNAGQYMIAMLSREIGSKINLIESPEEAVNFVKRPDVVKARQHLCEDEFGEPRFVLLDDREGTLDHVKKQCETLYKKHGCRVIVIDPIQDLMEGVDTNEQLSFFKWMKAFVKNGVTFVNIAHVRKASTSTDNKGKRVKRDITEDDVHGVGALTKSAGANIILQRDKYAEDSIERNTTEVIMPKCRWTGNTGPAGKWFYDNKTHTMYDLQDYLNSLVDNYIEEQYEPSEEEGAHSPPQF